MFFEIHVWTTELDVSDFQKTLLKCTSSECSLKILNATISYNMFLCRQRVSIETKVRNRKKVIITLIF